MYWPITNPCDAYYTTEGEICKVLNLTFFWSNFRQKLQEVEKKGQKKAYFWGVCILTRRDGKKEFSKKRETSKKRKKF